MQKLWSWSSKFVYLTLLLTFVLHLFTLQYNYSSQLGKENIVIFQHYAAAHRCAASLPQVRHRRSQQLEIGKKQAAAVREKCLLWVLPAACLKEVAGSVCSKAFAVTCSCAEQESGSQPWGALGRSCGVRMSERVNKPEDGEQVRSEQNGSLPRYLHWLAEKGPWEPFSLPQLLAMLQSDPPCIASIDKACFGF